MARALHLRSRLGLRPRTATAAEPARQAYQLLHWGFATLPVITGVDKLALHLLTEWTIYVAPFVVRLSPIAVDPLMQIAGAVEIGLGVLVAVRPRIGAYFLAAWLFGIVINLLLAGAFYDVALRDLGLVLAALALARLSVPFEHVRRLEGGR